MNKKEATKIVQETFDGKFNIKNYTSFLSNLFKSFSPKDRLIQGQYIKEAYRKYVSQYRILGSFEDSEENKIDFLQVQLLKNTSLERARTAQRNFVAEYLKTRQKDAALVAFLSPETNEWRFSLVKLEYSIEVKEGKLKTTEETNPAKRWSFLIGDHEGSHTVTTRFLDLLQSDIAPNLQEIEEAFNIEKVTKEFFDKYCELFLRMKESLDSLLLSDPDIKADFDSKEISTIDFAKKTMGQMAFLYFLQKKGWFGVAPNADWGTGTKTFLRDLFNRREKYGINFFDNILEPLFYEALAQDRGKEAIYPRLNNCRMPFLNGGLFEPMNGYSWETTHILLPDELFSNKNKTKEGDIGDGILDIFDRYNFTVNENEPLEKEVAVDPEMLGKVFENLLEIKDRKSKGAFYTPREIVHYMCQECLINFLETETEKSIPRDDIQALIQNGSRIIQNDLTVLEKGKETDTYKFLLPENIRRNAKTLDESLANIKVCDPAVGSGAFPLGMLNEIVQARLALAVHTGNTRSHYDLKLHTITNSLYGVDLDGGAVDIAKLRLWLALVVEENEPHPLPNLDHKIMQGNSLISEYEGIKLFDESILTEINSIETERKEVDDQITELQREYFAIHSGSQPQALKTEELIRIEKLIKSYSRRKTKLGSANELQAKEMSIFDTPSERKIAHEKSLKLQAKIERFISESRRSEKQALKEEIDNLKWELIEATLIEQGNHVKLAEIKKLRGKHQKPFFIWKLEFSDVFRQKGGFDVVIANPPYVGEKNNARIFRPIAEGNLGHFYQGKMDLFYFFFHLALDLGKEHSEQAFITTNYYLTATGGTTLRRDLKNRASIKKLVNFNELRIFESALGQHNIITIFSKTKNKEEYQASETTKKGSATDNILHSILKGEDQETSYFSNDQKELYEGDSCYMRLAGVKNEDNPINSVLEKMSHSEVKLGDIVQTKQGIVSGADKLTDSHLAKYPSISGDKGTGIFTISKRELKDLNLTDFEMEYVFPFYKNSQISRYHTKTDNQIYIIYLTKYDDIEKLPNLNRHLIKYREILEKKRECREGKIPWYSLHWPRDKKLLQSEKIVNSRRAKFNTFAIERGECFEQSDIAFSVIKETFRNKTSIEYLLALLNSKLYYIWLYNKGKRKGDMLELYGTPLSEIPILINNPKIQSDITSKSKRILNLTQKSDYNPKAPPMEVIDIETQIDALVFDLYGLTESERKLVNESYPKH